MNAVSLPSIDIDPMALLLPKALGAWSALEERYASQITRSELDYLFALFVFGLTTPFYEQGSPTAHLEACRVLILRKLDAERMERALRSVPAASKAWVEKAFLLIEQLGIKDGQALFKQQISNQTINTIELSPVREPGGSKETL